MMAESINRSTPRCVWGFTLAASFRSMAFIWAAFQSTTPLGFAPHSEDAHASARSSIVLMIGQYTTVGGQLRRSPRLPRSFSSRTYPRIHSIGSYIVDRTKQDERTLKNRYDNVKHQAESRSTNCPVRIKDTPGSGDSEQDWPL